MQERTGLGLDQMLGSIKISPEGPSDVVASLQGPDKQPLPQYSSVDPQ